MTSERLTDEELVALTGFPKPAHSAATDARGHFHKRGDGLRSSWKRAMQRLATDYPNIERTFTFHDIKAKGISDFDGNIHDKQQFSGHKTVNQVNVYDRKVAVVPTIGSTKK